VKPLSPRYVQGDIAQNDLQTGPSIPQARAAATILHVISNLAIGGSQALLLKHVSRLQSFPGISSEVCVLGARSEAHPDYLRRLAVPIHFLNFAGDYRNPAASFACIRRLRRLVRKQRPDIVHTYLWNADVCGALAVVGLGTPRVCHIVDRRGDRNAPRLLARLRTRGTGWLLRRGSARFVAVSHACRRHGIEHLRLPLHQVITAHNGVELSEFTPGSKAVFRRWPITFGTISRFADEKGHLHLIEAFRMLAADGAPVRLKIAGTGRTLPDYRALVERLGVPHVVEFVGQVSSAASFYNELDAFVIPSTYAEGLPTTILEAMASAIPVIATDVGGAAEAIREGREGLIVEPGDPRALVEAVGRLLAAPETARDMGRAGRKRVERDFTAQAMTVAIVEQVYAALLPTRVHT
jgi:glycosyltransferase involved in cell wall biosynthesis